MRKLSAMHAKKALVVSTEIITVVQNSSSCSITLRSEYLLMIFVHKWPVAIFSASIYVYIHFYFRAA